MLREEKGVTLMLLVAMIIALIILARVSINAIVGDDDVIEESKKTKEDAIVVAEMEKVKLSGVQAASKNSWGMITIEDFETQLNQNVGVKDEKYSIEELDSGKFLVTFLETNRKYTLDQNGKVEVYK